MLFPSLGVCTAVFLLFKAFDYSLFRAAKEVLYIPLPFDARYRVKEFNDAFLYRASKGGTSALIGVAGPLIGRIPGAGLALIALCSTLVWLCLLRRLLPTGRISGTANPKLG